MPATCSRCCEGIDRREKLLAYRTLPSLKAYVLIAPDRAEIEVHTRLRDTSWEITTLEAVDPVSFGGIGFPTEFAAIYEESGVDL